MNAAEIAAKLSKAQRQWLLDAHYSSCWRIVSYRKKACDLGLCTPGTSKITGLGLAVRAILQAKEPTDER